MPAFVLTVFQIPTFQGCYIILIIEFIQSMFPGLNNTTFCYPFYYMSQPQQVPTSYYQPMMFVPQFIPPLSHNHEEVVSSRADASNLQTNQQNRTTDNGQNPIIVDVSQNSPQQNNQIPEKQIPVKNKKVKKSPQKPKRPLTYLTQRAYYLNQRLKGNLKSSKRVLRKRYQPKCRKRSQLKEKTKEKIQKLRVKEMKTKTIVRLAQKKPAKLQEKVKLKKSWVYIQTQAELPVCMDFNHELIQLINKKKFNLLSRRFYGCESLEK